MHAEVKALAEALDKLASAIKSHSGDERPSPEIWGHWNAAVISPVQMADYPTLMASSLGSRAVEKLSDDERDVLRGLTKSVDGLVPTIVPHIFNGNVTAALPAYLGTLQYVDYVLQYIFGFEAIKDRKSLPRNILRRVEDAEVALDKIIEGSGNIGTKVAAIQSAYDAAEELPATLGALEKAHKEISSIASESDQNLGRIKLAETSASKHVSSLEALEAEAIRIVDSCGAAYRATTSKGLAASFEESAAKLNTSIKWWITGLIAALIAIGLIGYSRVELLNESLRMVDPAWNIVLAKLAITVLSVSPAVWFAWMATKQIGQRFRMAEDYTFKASVAKAYEGYRREAARLDPRFEAQLFGSALTRVDEAPLRLVEPQSYGSPFHEAIGGENREFWGGLRDRLAAAVGKSSGSKPPTAKKSPESEAAEP